MDLPYGTFYRPRQEKLIAKDEWAIVWIKTDSKYTGNEAYLINDRTFESDIAPFLHGEWEKFNRFFRLDPWRGIYIDRRKERSPVVYSSAEHRGDPKLPNITVVPNLLTREYRGLAQCWEVFGCTMGHFHLPDVSGCRVQEVYEFQSYGMLVLDREEGWVEIWVAQDGDKVAVPNGCHMTLYNLGDKDNPLITLDFTDPKRNRANKDLVSKCGPIILAYYNDFEVVFTLNELYINNPNHKAGVRIASPSKNLRDRQVRVGRGVRLELGRLLYEELTQNHDLIGQFSTLGIRIRQATPETTLEPLEPGAGSRLYFSTRLVGATRKGTNVYNYFFPNSLQVKPDPTSRKLPLLDKSGAAEQKQPSVESHETSCLTRRLIVLVEGVGDWVDKTYRKLFLEKGGEKISAFYADDTRWKPRPTWASEDSSTKEGLQTWETYLDKADLDNYDKYRMLLPDVVFVVTPDFTHSAVARHWLGKAPVVFVEKPFDSQVKNVDDLLIEMGQYRATMILGLDHYQFYAKPVNDSKSEILKHLGGALERVEFYLTENRPIESDRARSLQYGLSLDLLPHFIALLSYFGNVSTIDEIRVIEAAQYYPLEAKPPKGDKGSQPPNINISDIFYNETYARIEFTFEDISENGFRVPCLAVVGKGFSQSVKYLELLGQNGNAVRIDLNEAPPDDKTGYPWDSLFYLQGSTMPRPVGSEIEVLICPYSGHKLNILLDKDQKNWVRQRLARKRYEKLLDDLLNNEKETIDSMLSLTEGREIVLALDRIWWAIQATRPWLKYSLLNMDPLDGPLSAKADYWQIRDSELEELNSKQRAIIRPIRSRGANPRQANRSARQTLSEQFSTRGNIRTCSQEAVSESALQSQKSLLLKSLVEELRREVHHLPITILLHNWGSVPADEFLNVLTPWLEKGDALWLIPVEETKTSTALPEIEGGAMLNLSKLLDERIYNNLIGEIVFFPAMEESEVDHAEQFANRARAAVIYRSGKYADDVLQSARSVGLITYLWSDDTSLVEYEGEEKISRLPEPDDLLIGDDIQEFGRRLKEVTLHLERLFYRRPRFRTRMRKIFDKNPERLDLPESLILLAHEHQWPLWAIESLTIYVELNLLPDGRKRAFVWHYILNCVPENYEYEVSKNLCANKFHEIHMPLETAGIIKGIAEVFEKELRANPFASDSSVIGAVINAMQQIESDYPETAEKAREAREKILKKTRG